MGHWGFVIMAYAIVWSSVAIYVTLLKRRLAKARRDLEAARARHGVDAHEAE